MKYLYLLSGYVYGVIMGILFNGTEIETFISGIVCAILITVCWRKK